ncbi:MAG: thioredoxin family protein [bacterium]|nr:thioredoxin family protein [bacterium]
MGQYIDMNSENELRSLFQKEFKNPVQIDIYTGEKPNDFSKFTLELLKELVSIDSRLQLNVHAQPDEPDELIPIYPTIQLGKNLGADIFYWGAPYQHEFNGFISSLVFLSKQETDLPEAVKSRMSELVSPVKLYVFVTPQCPYCPYSVIIGHKMAFESKGKIASICVEAQENQELSEKFNVSSVPHQVINDDPESTSIGVPNISTFFEQILSYSKNEPETVEEAREEEPSQGLLLLKPEEITKALGKHKKTIAVFTGDDCEQCEGVKKILNELSSELGDDVKFIEINLGKDREVPGYQPITMIPTVISFEGEKEHGRWIGSLPPPILKSKVKKFSEKKTDDGK